MTCEVSTENRKVPHIAVSVEFCGERVQLDGACFIDAIAFLCRAEEALRSGLKLKDGQDCDMRTTEIQEQNMARLLGGFGCKNHR